MKTAAMASATVVDMNPGKKIEINGKKSSEEAIFGFVTDAAMQTLAAEVVILFGSRARGDAHERSDYDFAIQPAPSKSDQWGRFADLVSEHAPTLHNIDLVNLSGEIDPAFRARIHQEGKVLYRRSK